MFFTAFRTSAIFLALAVPAFADSINLAAYSFYGVGYGPSVTSIGSYTTTNPYGSSYGTASYSGALTPAPSVSAASNSAQGDLGQGISNSFAELQYQIEVNGPTSTVQVVVNSAGMVSGNATQPGNDQDTFLGVDARFSFFGMVDETNITINNSGGSIEYGFAPSISDTGFNSSPVAGGGYAGSFFVMRTLTLMTGVSYNVDLLVKANTLSQGTGMSGQASAFVDPTFTIANGVANADQYSFSFSDGIGNTPASAPEPATWAFLSSGFAAIAGLKRRFRKSAL